LSSIASTTPSRRTSIFERIEKKPEVWLERVAIARNKRCTDKELNELLDVVRSHRQEFLERWNEHFGN
jgi:hypothetical protein